MFNPGNIHYEMADRARGIAYGGMGAMQLLVKNLGLDEAINRRLRLFKLRNPYFESDHILNIAYNILCNGECLEDIERLQTMKCILTQLALIEYPIRQQQAISAVVSLLNMLRYYRRQSMKFA